MSFSLNQSSVSPALLRSSPFQTLTAGATIFTGQSGATFYLSTGAAGTNTIYLPNTTGASQAPPGTFYKFQTVVAGGHPWQITATGAATGLFNGFLGVTIPSSSSVLKSAANSFTFAGTGSAIGDTAKCQYNGSTWAVWGQAASTGTGSPWS